MHLLDVPTGIRLVAADHPSLAGDVDAFLHRLERHDGGSASARSGDPGHGSLRPRGGFRLAAVECGCLVGLARVDGAGELFVAVAVEHRRRGIGTTLAVAMATRARELRYARLVVDASRRSAAVQIIGDRLGALTIDLGGGRTELLLDVGSGSRTG